MTMRPLLIANWKMNLNVQDSCSRAKKIVAMIARLSPIERKKLPDIAIAPSFSALHPVSMILKKSSHPIHLASQDCSWMAKGAYTGEESAVFLQESGVTYSILGHSERRIHMSETDSVIARKVEAVLTHTRSVPVICIGERSEDRHGPRRRKAIQDQLRTATSFICKEKPKRSFVIAYEPVWAIGTGVACAPADCGIIYALIVKLLTQKLGEQYVSDWCRILYGGSVSSGNIAGFVSPGISDGGLVGTASLDASEFFRILRRIS